MSDIRNSMHFSSYVVMCALSDSLKTNYLVFNPISKTLCQQEIFTIDIMNQAKPNAGNDITQEATETTARQEVKCQMNIVDNQFF